MYALGLPLDDALRRGTVSGVESVLPADELRELAHELRSPLMALSAACDLVEDANLAGSMRLAVEHMRGLIAGHLEGRQCASAEGTARSVLSSVVLDAVSIVALTSSVPVVVLEESMSAEVLLGALELRRAVVNIVANAVRFAPEGSQVEVYVGSANGFGVLEVRDFGPGVPGELLSVLGSRPVESSSGFGVGLFLARSLVESCGGSLSLSLADPGLLVRLELPVHSFE